MPQPPQTQTWIPAAESRSMISITCSALTILPPHGQENTDSAGIHPSRSPIERPLPMARRTPAFRAFSFAVRSANGRRYAARVATTLPHPYRQENASSSGVLPSRSRRERPPS